MLCATDCNCRKMRYNKREFFQNQCNKTGVFRIIMVKGVNKQMASVKQYDSRELDRLLSEIADGDQDALAALFHETSASVYAYSLSILKNVHDAEDVLQECYLSIHASAHQYRSSGKPMAWIITIARNHCLMRLRERGKTAELSLDEWKAELSAGDEMTTMDKILVAELMSRLSEQERQIVVLHAVAGFKHRQIAEFLSIPLPTVLSKYHRAIQKMNKHL